MLGAVGEVCARLSPRATRPVEVSQDVGIRLQASLRSGIVHAVRPEGETLGRHDRSNGRLRETAAAENPGAAEGDEATDRGDNDARHALRGTPTPSMAPAGVWQACMRPYEVRSVLDRRARGCRVATEGIPR